MLLAHVNRFALKPRWATGKIFFKPEVSRAFEVLQVGERGWAVRDAAMHQHIDIDASAFLADVG